MQKTRFLSWGQTLRIASIGAIALILHELSDPLIELSRALLKNRSFLALNLPFDDTAFVCGGSLLVLTLLALFIPWALNFVRRWTNHKCAALPDLILLGVTGGLFWPAFRQTHEWGDTLHPVFSSTFILLIILWLRMRTISHPKRYAITQARFGLTNTDEGPLPTIDPDVDQLGRIPFCTALLERLSITAPDGALVIGLSGSWGSGKSTVLNYCAGELEKLPNGPRVIAFDAWLFRGSGRTIEGLLGLIGEEIENNYLYRNARSVARQLAKLLSVGEPRLRELPKIFEPSDDPVKQREKFAKLIADTNERFVVLIDDLERLNQEEIHAVLKTVREGALVPGITYLLSYDRAHLVELLGAAGGVGIGYLDKIIQEEMELSRPELSKWRAFAQGELNLILAGADDKLAKDFHERLVGVEEEIAEILQTPRHLKRVRLAVQHISGRLRKVLNPFDLLVLELLRQRYRGLYDLIRKHPNFACDARGFEDLLRGLPGGTEKTLQPFKDAVAEYLKGTGLDRPAIEKLLAAIFPSILSSHVKLSEGICFRFRRICDQSYFDWYFNLTPTGYVPEQEKIENMIDALNQIPTLEDRKKLLADYLLIPGATSLRDRFASIRFYAVDIQPDAILPTVEAFLDSAEMFAAMEENPNRNEDNSCAVLVSEIIAQRPSEAEVAEGMEYAILHSPNVLFASELLILAGYELSPDSEPSPIIIRCQQAFDCFIEKNFIAPKHDIFANELNIRGIVTEFYSDKSRMRDYLVGLLATNPANWLKLLRQYVNIHNEKTRKPIIRIRDDALRNSPLLDGLTAAIRDLPIIVTDQTEALMITEFTKWIDAQNVAAKVTAADPETQSDSVSS